MLREFDNKIWKDKSMKTGKMKISLWTEAYKKMFCESLDEAEPMVTVDDKYISDVQKLLAQY